ncbi:hypothetical protein CC80DRAFT_506364 [Byssothecium circinans]|uniref:Uncharacterized protein n=1 Tax=Byssothecium circinans TaxID=147558 RepID=A0A6A5TN72_9PLEO|nr:hypothetical protein CC80DRAFT_506364 [Byssothecium circinans]
MGLLSSGRSWDDSKIHSPRAHSKLSGMSSRKFGREGQLDCQVLDTNDARARGLVLIRGHDDGSSTSKPIVVEDSMLTCVDVDCGGLSCVEVWDVDVCCVTDGWIEIGCIAAGSADCVQVEPTAGVGAEVLSAVAIGEEVVAGSTAAIMDSTAVDAGMSCEAGGRCISPGWMTSVVAGCEEGAGSRSESRECKFNLTCNFKTSPLRGSMSSLMHSYQRSSRRRFRERRFEELNKATIRGAGGGGVWLVFSRRAALSS